MRWAPAGAPQGGGGGSWPASGSGSSPSRQERAAAGASPRGQALQGKQKSVVNAVPNPKWLLPNCNPIKVRLVYLSSSGLFITVQMAATFGRLSSSLPAARHAQLSSTESGPAPVRGREWRPQGTRGLVSLPPGLTNPSLCRLAADGAGSRQCCHTWCRAPDCRCSWGTGKQQEAPLGGRGQWGLWGGTPCLAPRSSEQRAPQGATGNAGWKRKPGKIKGTVCRKGSHPQPPHLHAGG